MQGIRKEQYNIAKVRNVGNCKRGLHAAHNKLKHNTYATLIGPIPPANNSMQVDRLPIIPRLYLSSPHFQHIWYHTQIMVYTRIKGAIQPPNDQPKAWHQKREPNIAHSSHVHQVYRPGQGIRSNDTSRYTRHQFINLVLNPFVRSGRGVWGSGRGVVWEWEGSGRRVVGEW